MVSKVILFVPLVVAVAIILSILRSLIDFPSPFTNHQIQESVRFNGNSSENIMWFIQISDLHVSQYYDLGRVDDLLSFSNTTLQIIKPPVTLVTGDLTDAKANDFSGSGQLEAEWKMYRTVANEAAKTTLWLDIRGNHDNFDVKDREGSQDFFATYGESGNKLAETNLGHYHKVITANGVTIGFIGVDATIQPGLKRPFNFIGQLTPEDISNLQDLKTRVSSKTNLTVWFGHYPSSTIAHSSGQGLPDVGNEGLIYLCGHLHNLHGIVKDMFALHPTGFREAELSDWRDHRRWRLLGVDHGLLSYRDFTHAQWPAVLVTWPPAAGRELRNGNSSHIRILAFAPSLIESISISIDGRHIGHMELAKSDFPLYVLAWDQTKYGDVHKMTVEVKISGNTEPSLREHVFSVTGGGYSSLTVLGKLVIRMSLSRAFETFFFVMVIVCVAPLVICRWSFTTAMGGGQSSPVPLGYAGISVLASVDTILVPLIALPLYLILGPLCLAEVVSGEYGMIFSWGILLWHTNADNDSMVQFIPDGTTWLYTGVHLAMVHLPLILTLSHILYLRYKATSVRKDETHYSKFASLWRTLIWNNQLLPHVAMFLLVAVQAYLVHALYLAYSTVSVVFGPMRVGELIMTLYLWRRASVADAADFHKFEKVSRSSSKKRMQ